MNSLYWVGFFILSIGMFIGLEWFGWWVSVPLMIVGFGAIISESSMP